MEERVRELEKELQHWKANHADVVAKKEGCRRACAALAAELRTWQNIADSRLGDERKYLGQFRRAKKSAQHLEHYKSEIRRLTRERDALKDEIGHARALEIIRSVGDSNA